jgi:hypothetical protein
MPHADVRASKRFVTQSSLLAANHAIESLAERATTADALTLVTDGMKAPPFVDVA